jgi:ribosomal protein S18 acetylase RimI-like enzyme
MAPGCLLLIEFRPLTRDDEPFLWEMLYQALYVPKGNPPLPREVIHTPELSRYVEGWGQPGDEGFLALVDGIPVGAVWIRLLIGDNRGYGYVDDQTPELSIAILPEYRGMGIGESLMLRLFESVKDRHVSICLSVSADNPARRLYERLGFIEVGDESQSLKMVKRLRED